MAPTLSGLFGRLRRLPKADNWSVEKARRVFFVVVLLIEQDCGAMLKHLCHGTVLVTCCIGYSLSAQAEQLQDRPAVTAADDSRTAFDTLQQSCAVGAPSLDRLRVVLQLDICILYADYEHIVARLRDDRATDFATIEPALSALLGPDTVDWEPIAARLATNRDGEQFRLLAPRFVPTLSASQRLRWVSTLLLLDRLLDRNLLTFLDNDVPVEQALRSALGGRRSNYVYVDFDAALALPFSNADEWDKATMRRAAFAVGSSAAFFDPETASHMRLRDSDLEAAGAVSGASGFG